MSEVQRCDLCGRSGVEVSVLKEEQDELWVCDECCGESPSPSPQAMDGDLDALVGESAGAICHTLNLPYVPPYRTVIDAASKIAYDEDRYMSAWSFVAQWPDGTTVWHSEDGASEATVAPDGSIRVQSR